MRLNQGLLAIDTELDWAIKKRLIDISLNAPALRWMIREFCASTWHITTSQVTPTKAVGRCRPDGSPDRAG